MPLRDLLPRRSEFDRDHLERLTDQARLEIALGLYREASHVIQACARNHHPAKLTDRPRTICCGLLVRIAKYMLAVDTLTTHLGESADVLMALNRCMLESAVNVRYLLTVDDDETYEAFVKKGLGPEREYHDWVEKTVAARGNRLPIDDRIQASILRVVERSGVKLEDIPVKYQEWGPNMRDKLKEVDMEGLYVGYREWSHAVHGSWADVLMRHLKHSDDGYGIEWSLGSTDSRLLTASARLNLEAAGFYADKWFEEEDKNALFELMPLLFDDFDLIGQATEDAIQRA